VAEHGGALAALGSCAGCALPWAPVALLPLHAAVPLHWQSRLHPQRKASVQMSTLTAVRNSREELFRG
jgi:hypothetical protein